MNKDQKKALRNKFKQNEREKLKDSLPFNIEIFEDLFEYLDLKLTNNECDHTLKITSNFLETHNLPFDKSIDWMREHGGYCDCEVLDNIENEIESIF